MTIRRNVIIGLASVAALWCMVALFMSGCGGASRYREGVEHTTPKAYPPHMEFILRSQALMEITAMPEVKGRYVYATQSVPVSIVSSPSVTFNIDTSNFNAPAVITDLLDFGSLVVSDLRDNKLRICGANGKQKCTKAHLRIYTTSAGAGLYNSEDGYGVPMYANSGEVGHTSNNALLMQTINIPHNKNVLSLSDFNPSPLFNITVDFSNAGAGSYSTTLVVEYGLSL